MRDSSPLNDCSGDLTGGVFVFYKVMNSENVSLFLCSVSVVAVSLTRVANSQPDGELWRAPCSPEVNSQLTRGDSTLSDCYVKIVATTKMAFS